MAILTGFVPLIEVTAATIQKVQVSNNSIVSQFWSRTIPNPFHIAVQVRDIPEARQFYGEKLGFAEGRSSENWIDFNMFGHQFVVHLNPELAKLDQITNPVDGQHVPVPHCGVVLSIPEFKALSEKVSRVIENFVIEPYVRFEGEPGEQWTMFFLDPSGNALEFKAFQDIEKSLFATT